MKAQTLNGPIYRRAEAKKFIESVTNSGNGRQLPKAAIIHSALLPLVSKATSTVSVPTGWDKELFVAMSVPGMDVGVLDVLLRKQMGAPLPAQYQECAIYALAKDPGNDILKKISRLGKLVSGGRQKALWRIKAALQDNMMVVATKGNTLASFLFVSKQHDALNGGVALHVPEEPVLAPAYPKSLGNGLIKYAVNSMHCFSSDSSFVVMMERADDPENNAAMARMGFACSAPVVRKDGVYFLWVYNTAQDLGARTDLAGDQGRTSADRVKEFFISNPRMSVADCISACRVPGYDEPRLRALKAVATRGSKSGSGSTAQPGQPTSLPQPARPGAKPLLATTDDIRAVVKAKGYRSLKDLLADYDIDPSLDDKSRPNWRAVAIIASNTRLQKQ